MDVARGAHHAMSALGSTLEMVTPEQLPALSALAGTEGPHQHKVYGCVVDAEHFVRREDDGVFEMAEYFAHPERYVPTFHEAIAPHTSMLVTAMYWDKRFPRLLSLKQMEGLGKGGERRLLAVADITCDVDGAVESLVRSTSIDAPFYVYDVERRRENGGTGVDGDGVLMLGVDILPSELPSEASEHFGGALHEFIPSLADAGAPLPAERGTAAA